MRKKENETRGDVFMNEEPKSTNEIVQKRREAFRKQYEETFGVKPIFEPISDEEYGFTLHYYGIKSHWM